MSSNEIAEEIRSFTGSKADLYNLYVEEGFEGVRDLAMDQTSSCLGDRLRYFPDSEHRK